jgi:membrane glycosyltransferase
VAWKQREELSRAGRCAGERLNYWHGGASEIRKHNARLRTRNWESPQAIFTLPGSFAYITQARHDRGLP